MTQEQEEVMTTLLGTIDSKVHVRKKMKKMFKELNTYELSKAMKDFRKSSKTVSFRNVTYRDKLTILKSLLVKKAAGEVKEIFIFLTEEPSRNTPPDFYRAVLGDTVLNGKRAVLRGKKVRLIGFTEDNLNIIVSLPTEEATYRFVIQDINCSHNIELKLK